MNAPPDRAAPLAEFDEAAARRRAKKDWLRALERTSNVTSESNRTLARIVDEKARETPEAPALVGEETSLTYRALATRIEEVAGWAEARGLAKGDCVALHMTNSPEYAAIWLGLSRVGVVVALVNTQLRGASLAGVIDACAPKFVVADHEGTIALREAGLDRLETTEPNEIACCIGAAQNVVSSHVTLSDVALLVFTSGTTGLPKAARVSHYRIVMWAEWFAGLMDARAHDRLYNCLPMYHSVGGVVAVGAMLASGGATIVRRAFSARMFWTDIAQSGATLFQYIGELCRYLLARAPDNPPQHNLRLICGNGLRGDVWEAFQTRFAIPRILEFYAATEGTFSLFNVEGKPGAIGRTPPFIAHRSPTAIVRFDIETQAPQRAGDGFCLRCMVGETGEAIGRIDGARQGLSSRFEGYTNAGESERKILRNVFEPGDAWFRTGDLMRQDSQGYYIFVDRIGDTFRWKGENVSTSEIAALVCAIPGVADAAVYGVAAPGADGRAGMVSLVVGDDFDLEVFARVTARDMPAYARPIFLRLCKGLPTTGTFRLQKSELQADGFDPTRITDELFVLESASNGYRNLDAPTYDRIMSGAMRL
ncbi:MAG: long-chain-acyl-CoA synthetase [Hyphomicrobiales bacterium]|nr:long-chain-acyl-CoA synthetase [Hyphomicrobiales bacterium]